MSDSPPPRTSTDSDRPPSPSPLHEPNGAAPHDEDDASLDPVARLQRELQRTRDEKDALAGQYRTLLGKLTAMRTTLGNKLRQDAEELDRQQELVQTLAAQNDDLARTVDALKAELVMSNEEAERASRELEALRSRALQDSAQEVFLRERELRELQGELEQVRLERDEWERKALQEHVAADEARTGLENARRDLEIEREAREREAGALAVEREKVANLQSVLEDFQAAKDHELQQAVRDYEARLVQTTQSLAEYKSRALSAELQLEESAADSSRTHELEKEVKEKTLLIGKLRHEAVIMNEHLMEALRRLRRSASDTAVDRRLVTNIVLSYLTTPRGDSKRFEMLTLLASVLQWSDDERERAGLQRKGPASGGGSLWGRATGKGRPDALEKTDETESFSRLWVEFLLTEASSGDGSSPSSPASPRSPNARPTGSLPPTPTKSTAGSPYLSPGSQNGGARRLPSFSSLAGLGSAPHLPLEYPPGKGKGKERASE